MKLTEPNPLPANWRAQGRKGLDSVLSIIYKELQNVARRHLIGAHDGPTVRTHDLVHETYLRLAQSQPKEFADHRQFFSHASFIIRHVFVNHLRAAQNHQPERGKVLGYDAMVSAVSGEGLSPDMLLAVHEALNQLELIDPKQARIAEMKFFAGMPHNEIAEVLEVSPPTVDHHWQSGRRRLALLMSGRASVDEITDQLCDC